MTKAIERQLDESRLRPIHILTLAVSAIVMMIDGYDLYVVGWILPTLSDSFGVSRIALTPLLLMQQAAMLAGSYFLTPYADRFGRKLLLLICLAGIGLSSIATLFATSLAAFTIGRLMTSLFAAAIVPNLLALTSEVAPSRYRATFATATFCGAMGGALIGALMQAYVLEPHGWRGAILVGGLLPLAAIPFVALLLPESLRYLLNGRPSDRRIPRLLRAYGVEARPGSDETGEPANVGAEPPSGLLRLFAAPHRRATIFLWASFFCSLAFVGQWGAWSSTIFHDVMGLNWQQISTLTTIYTVLGALGALSVGVAIDRFGFRRVLPFIFCMAFAGVVAIGLFPKAPGLLVALSVMSFFQVAGQAGLAALAPTLYPDHVRAGAVGAAMGAGRAGSIAGPALGALLIASGSATATIFIGLSAPLLAGALLLFMMLRRRECPDNNM